MMPLIATILLVISVAVGNVFMTSYLEYSVTIKYVRSTEYIFSFDADFIKAVLKFCLSKGIPTTKLFLPVFKSLIAFWLVIDISQK